MSLRVVGLNVSRWPALALSKATVKSRPSAWSISAATKLAKGSWRSVVTEAVVAFTEKKQPGLQPMVALHSVSAYAATFTAPTYLIGEPAPTRMRGVCM